MSRRSSLRSLAIAGCLAGCDFQPPPKSTTSAATTPTHAGPPSDAQVAPNAPDVPGAPDAPGVTPECRRVADHVARILVESAKDPGLRAAYERAQAKMAQTMSEACTTRGWSVETQRCYLESKTEAEARACQRTLTPPAAGAAHTHPD